MGRKKAEKRRGFLLYNDMQDDIRRLTMAQRGELLTVVFQYSATRTEPEITDTSVGIVFDAWKRWLDADFEHYEEVARARSEAGRKGGAPRGNQNAKKTPVDNDEQNKPKQANDCFEEQSEQNQSKQANNNNNNNNSNSNSNRDNDYSAVFDFYANSFNSNLNSHIASLLKTFIDDMSSELVIEAIRESIRHNVHNWNYLWAILKDWRGKGYKTVDDLRKSEGGSGQNDGTDSRRNGAENPYDIQQLPGIRVL